MNPFIIGAGISAVSHMTGSLVNADQQAKNRKNQLKIQKIGQEFQEHMASTNYQRTIKDMKAAGLNPALAATAGTAVSLQSSSSSESVGSMMDTLRRYVNSSRNPRFSTARPK